MNPHTKTVMEQKVHDYHYLERLPSAINEDTAYQRLATRARQLLHFELAWVSDLSEYDTFWTTDFYSLDGPPVFTGFIKKPLNSGFSEIQNYIDSRPQSRFLDVDSILPRYERLFQPESNTSSLAYRTIEHIYGNRRTARSGVLLMNHIDEGITIIKRAMRYMSSTYMECLTERVIDAFCLHPLLQNDIDLDANYLEFTKNEYDPYTVMCVMEYRSIANEYLAKRQIQSIDEIRLSPILEVNLMLVADKVQNYKDFMTYHYGVHKDSENLRQYFLNWFKRLEINDGLYQKLIKHIPSV